MGYFANTSTKMLPLILRAPAEIRVLEPLNDLLCFLCRWCRYTTTRLIGFYKRTENLYTVPLLRIVARCDHNATGDFLALIHRNRDRGRHCSTDRYNTPTSRQETRDHRVINHLVARTPIVPYHDVICVRTRIDVCKPGSNRLRIPHRHLRRQTLPHDPPQPAHTKNQRRITHRIHSLSNRTRQPAVNTNALPCDRTRRVRREEHDRL